MRNTINQGYNHFLMDVSAMVKTTEWSEESVSTQAEIKPTRQVPKLKDNKKFLGRLRATRRYVLYGSSES